jgi:hypothetical protein
MEEAFPKDVESMRRLENSQWFEVHQGSYEKWANIAYAFAAGFIVSMAIFVK